MMKWLDSIFSHHVWTIIKWPFGALLLWFILTQIWYEETIPDYDKIIISDFIKIVNDTKNINIDFKNINLFDNKRIIKN